MILTLSSFLNNRVQRSQKQHAAPFVTAEHKANIRYCSCLHRRCRLYPPRPFYLITSHSQQLHAANSYHNRDTLGCMHTHTHMQAVHAKQQTNNSTGYNLEFLLFCLLHFLISLLSALVRPFQVSEIQISREQT